VKIFCSAIALSSSYLMTFFLVSNFVFAAKKKFFWGPLEKKSHQNLGSQSAPVYVYVCVYVSMFVSVSMSMSVSMPVL
jgi:hypothetical protein